MAFVNVRQTDQERVRCQRTSILPQLSTSTARSCIFHAGMQPAPERLSERTASHECLQRYSD